jgi:ribosomal-protein-alanine N-acetyltransferase
MKMTDPIALDIRKLREPHEVGVCARMMAESEPWITLRRDYEASVATLSDPSKEIYLAIVDKETVGFLIMNMAGAFVGYIQTICVASDWRHKGIGSRLLSFAEERILREVPNVFLCVSSFNEKARGLYERLGYRVVGELRDYIIPGESEILLRKTIAPLSEFKNKK